MSDNPASALEAVPFGDLIGAPLIAAVEADAQAAKTSADFIQAVGLTKGTGNKKKPIYVTFGFKRQKPDGSVEDASIEVPLLSIVPIPYLSVNSVAIDFKASITSSSQNKSQESSQEMKDLTGATSASVGWGPWKASAKFNGSVSSKKDSVATQNSEYSVEYNYDISVRAGRADMPAGMATVLNILSESIIPVSLPELPELTWERVKKINNEKEPKFYEEKDEYNHKWLISKKDDVIIVKIQDENGDVQGEFHIQKMLVNEVESQTSGWKVIKDKGDKKIKYAQGTNKKEAKTINGMSDMVIIFKTGDVGEVIGYVEEGEIPEEE